MAVNDNVLRTGAVFMGKLIQKRRIELGMSQHDLADRSGLRQETINRIEAAKYYMRLDTLFILLEALDLYMFFQAKQSEDPTAAAFRNQMQTAMKVVFHQGGKQE